MKIKQIKTTGFGWGDTPQLYCFEDFKDIKYDIFFRLNYVLMYIFYYGFTET